MNAYVTAQRTVAECRGPAAKKLCHHCARRAEGWVIAGHPDDYTVDTNRKPYTAWVNDDPMNYIPLCNPCRESHIKTRKH